MADPRFMIEELLKAASEEFGEQLDLDEYAECIIERDDGQELGMRVCENPAALQFFAPLGSPPVQDREAFYAFLLALNLNHEITDGATIGVDDLEDLIIMSKTVSVHDLDPAHFTATLAHLFEVVDRISVAISGDDPTKYGLTADMPGDQSTEGDDQSKPSGFV